jgi:predicted phage terminase large subunit-like protein
VQAALQNPYAVIRELNNRSLYHFLQYFWPIVSAQKYQGNWHIEYLCKELEQIAERVGNRFPKKHDLIVNIPPGTSKTITVSIMFPAWCWTQWPWMRFITASYSGALSLESADYCRELIKSPQFIQIYPEIIIREDKDTKSNFKVARKLPSPPGQAPKLETGGYRYSTSVGGTLMGFHGDILIVDDPLNPEQAASDVELGNANRWMEQTLPTRKTDKRVSPTILIMQRLHQDDPAGHMLEKHKENIKHICMPGEIRNYRKQVNPPELMQFYTNDLLDVNRMTWEALKDLEADLGQYGYSGQIGQIPTPPGGGMFKVDHLNYITTAPPDSQIAFIVRFWDKAGTKNAGAYTAGVKMAKLYTGKFMVLDVKRGRWGTDERERIIRATAEADGQRTMVCVEQEPGASGKESAEGTVRNLAGFSAYPQKPMGDKPHRADPFSVQVNNGNVILLNSTEWNRAYVEEMRFFPFGTYKDQIDASSGAFQKLVGKKEARRIT